MLPLLVSVGQAVPPFTPEYAQRIWDEATADVNRMPESDYTRNEHYSCGSGNWGDGPQCNQWDRGFSPCWPSTMTISASFDVDLVARWWSELCLEFAVPGRGQLGPGVNMARFAWNGRLGEYMGGEDPYHTSQMVTAMLRACRAGSSTPVQVIKHFIANEVEADRNAFISIVDERTLFEVYYPPFQAAIDGGISSFMCAYNLVQCTTGLCSNQPIYACANRDTLTLHLREKMGFRGFVMSDWDATKCQDAVSWTPGCSRGQYVNNDFAAKAGLDHEMPSCISFRGGVSVDAKDKAIRHKWAFKVVQRDWSAPRNVTVFGCSTSPGEDCYGDDLPDGTRRNTGLEECCNACSAASGCRAFTFNEYDDRGARSPTCYLKASCSARKPCGTCTAGVISGPTPAPSPTPAPAPTPTPPPSPTPPPTQLPEVCPQRGGDNWQEPCKLSLADRIIAESSVVLKNVGGLLPFNSSIRSIALVGNEACSSNPMAQSTGSGWNGFACNEVPKINVQQGLQQVLAGMNVRITCPDQRGENSNAADADVVLAVVAPRQTGEGSDRDTIQLESGDKNLIAQYAGSKLVVVMNVPGPMITSTWDSHAAALMITWLPGQQNGKGIAQALYGRPYQASGRLPFTFPKCRTDQCSIDDERASVLLGDKINNKQYQNYSEKALIGYRWYQAQGREVSFPFGFGLFAYGWSTVLYGPLHITNSTSKGVIVETTLLNSGLVGGMDVPQLYLSFPANIPGDAASKPKWVLKGFEKVHLQPNDKVPVKFEVTERDLSYWDDSPGASKWVCAKGVFQACVGANSRDAIDPKKGSCSAFVASC